MTTTGNHVLSHANVGSGTASSHPGRRCSTSQPEMPSNAKASQHIELVDLRAGLGSCSPVCEIVLLAEELLADLLSSWPRGYQQHEVALGSSKSVVSKVLQVGGVTAKNAVLAAFVA